MIINIPLQIDEQRLEDVVARDYEGKVLSAIIDEAKKAIATKSSKYYGDKYTDGMLAIAQEQVGYLVREHQDEIIAKASKELADRLRRSKKGKEILDGLEEKDA